MLVHQRFECSSPCVKYWWQWITTELFQWSVEGLYHHETYLGVSCHFNASIQELIKVLAELPWSRSQLAARSTRGVDDLACRVVEFSCCVVQISLGLLECLTAGRELQRQDTSIRAYCRTHTTANGNTCSVMGWHFNVWVHYRCFCVNTNTLNVKKSTGAGLTMSTSSFLLASPMLLRAMSTSFWPGRQFTQLFRECDTALATWNTAQRSVNGLPLVILTIGYTIQCPRAKL